MRSDKRGRRKWWIVLSIAFLALAAVVGLLVFLPGSGEEVDVYSFSYIGMTEFWGDSQESYGPVSTDKIQTVFLSDTQTVSELAVKEGDQVKKGDLIMRFDTTLSELQLERKRLEMEKEKLQLEQEKGKLNELLNTTPWKPPAQPSAPAEPDPGVQLSGSYEVSKETGRDGITRETAAVCWLKDGLTIDETLLRAICQEVETIHGGNIPSNPSQMPEAQEEDLSDEEEEKLPADGADEEDQGTPDGNEGAGGGDTPGGEGNEDEKETPDGSEGGESGEDTPGGEDKDNPPGGEGGEDGGDTPDGGEDEGDTSGGEGGDGTPGGDEDGAGEGDSSGDGETDDQETKRNSFYIIFRTSQDDMSNKEILTWQGFYVTIQDSGISFQLFPTYYLQETDPFYEEELALPAPDMNIGFGYTSAELQKMITEQRKAIREQEYKVRVAENAYKIMEKELSDGNIYAEIDGQVVSVLEEAEAKLNKKPYVKLSAGGGYVIRGSVSELAKDSLSVGQEVTVNDWETGGSYTGTIQQIGDFPSHGDGWNGMGNPTATFYPFTVFVDESANLQSGIYASIQYSSGTGSQGIYLENPFIRTVDEESYVLVRNSAGRLEKRPVILGKSLWGSYTEILSGVTEEDWLAFPYGKAAKAGAKTREGSLEALYNY